MTDHYCPSCDTELTSESINIAEGVALCPSCGKLTRLSEVIEYEKPSEEIVNDPPPGCSLHNDYDTTVIRISIRSFGGFLGALFICLFWNGITSVFVVIALSGLYANLVGPVPVWFPAPTMDDGPMGLGMTLFLCLFLTPFVTIGLIMFGAVLLAMGGSIVVRVGRDWATVKTGVGPIGYTRRFDPRKVKNISTGRSKIETNGEHKELIEIDADRTVRFASGLEEAKRDWLIAVLRRLLKDTGR